MIVPVVKVFVVKFALYILTIFLNEGVKVGILVIFIIFQIYKTPEPGIEPITRHRIGFSALAKTPEPGIEPITFRRSGYPTIVRLDGS